MRIPGLRKLLARVHQSSLSAPLSQSSLCQRYVRHISRITNISHRSGWSTRQPVELLYQPDNSWPLLQSQSSCAAETEGHSRHLLQVLLFTPLLCSTNVAKKKKYCRNVTMQTYESLNHCNISYTQINNFADFSVRNAR